MKLVEFPEQNTVIAKNQPQYRPMPAHVDPHRGVVTCCWKLSFSERLTLLLTGEVWQHIRTFGAPVQPQMLGRRRPGFYGDKLTETTA